MEFNETKIIMEYVIVMFFASLLAWFLFKKTRTKEQGSKTDLIKIDDKNYIVNGKRVSFEEDTPLLRYQQEREDKKHYRQYEQARLMYDRERIYEEWRKTTQFIHNYPDDKVDVKADDLEKMMIRYSHYLKMCSKLQEEHFILTEEEFVIKETHAFACISFKMFPILLGIAYTIHNEKTAKYINGNIREQIEQEFKEKWY